MISKMPHGIGDDVLRHGRTLMSSAFEAVMPGIFISAKWLSTTRTCVGTNTIGGAAVGGLIIPFLKTGL